MNLSLIYFDFPFWRAEVSRIALNIGKIKFNDIRVGREEFMRARSSGKLDDGTIIPFNQLPCLKINDETIAQTAGIARFCGKLSGLYPKDNDITAAKIDQFLDLITDITVLIFNAGRDLEADKKIVIRKEFFETEFTRKFKMLEKNIPENSDLIITHYFSIADIALWSFVEWTTSGAVDGFPRDFLKKYPKIKRVTSFVNEHPEIKKLVQYYFRALILSKCYWKFFI